MRRKRIQSAHTASLTHVDESLILTDYRETQQQSLEGIGFSPATGHMTSLNHIIRIINESREQLQSEFGVARIGIFGSVVHGTQDADSDIDILVEFDRPTGFVGFMRLEKRLAELLGMPVDLVTRKALKPHIGRRILQEVRYV